MCEALIGLFGALVGAAAAIGAVIIKDNRDHARREAADKPRCDLLRQMLEGPDRLAKDDNAFRGNRG
jgi:hypothetical protein